MTGACDFFYVIDGTKQDQDFTKSTDIMISARAKRKRQACECKMADGVWENDKRNGHGGTKRGLYVTCVLFWGWIGGSGSATLFGCG